MSHLKDMWTLVKKDLERQESRAVEELISAKEYRDIVRCQEKIKAIKSLYSMEFNLKE